MTLCHTRRPLPTHAGNFAGHDISSNAKLRGIHRADFASLWFFVTLFRCSCLRDASYVYFARLRQARISNSFAFRATPARTHAQASCHGFPAPSGSTTSNMTSCCVQRRPHCGRKALASRLYLSIFQESAAILGGHVLAANGLLRIFCGKHP